MNHLRIMLVLMLIFGIALTACGDDKKEEKEDTYHIGVLYPSDSLIYVFQAFQAGLRDAGYVEGQKVTYIHELRPNGAENLIAGAKNLVEQDVDMIVSLGTPATLVAKGATAENKLPVVFVPVNDPVGSGIVSSMSDHGSNLTGVRIGGFTDKQFDWLIKLAPATSVVFAPYNPNDPSATLSHHELLAAAESYDGIEIISPEAATIDTMIEAFNTMPAEVDAIFICADAMVGSLIGDVIEPVSLERQIPVAGFDMLQMEGGALFSYGYEFISTGRQASRLAVLIIEGADPADIPIETAEFFLSINLVTAEAIGLDISSDVLRQVNGLIWRFDDQAGLDAESTATAEAANATTEPAESSGE